MTSKPSKRCQHKSSSICSSCQLVRYAGVWASESSASDPTRKIPTDIASFVKDTLHPSPKTSTQTQPQSKKPTQQPTSTTKSNNQRPSKYASYSLTLRQQPKHTTPTSSVAATRASSPITYRTASAPYSPRQATPATTNAAVFVRGDPCALMPQTASRPGADLPRRHVAPVYESDGSSNDGNSSDDDEDA